MVTNDLEFYSFHRAERSIRRSDVVLFLLDATLDIADPDKKLAKYIADQYKPVIIVVNKWDAAKEATREHAKDKALKIDDGDLMEQYAEYISKSLQWLDYAPVAFVTAKEGKNVQAVLDLSQHLFKQANERLTTGKLNRAVRQVLEEKTPSTPRGERPKIYYATQIGVSPPTIALVVNNPDWVNENYQRFMINRFRDLLPYPEVPMKLLIRSRGAGRGKIRPEDLNIDLAEGEEQVKPRITPKGAARTKKSTGVRSGNVSKRAGASVRRIRKK
jgi:GTPase